MGLANARGRVSGWARRLECPVDANANYRNTVWCNRDLIPIPEDRRTWTWQGFTGYWLVAAPLFIVVTSVCGILITDAAATIYGEYIWNPFELLMTVQAHSLSPAARAGTFFAGLGFLTDQLALCQMLNGVSTGMDMAALCPKWINIRRGCYILTVLAIVILPWHYVTNPGTFIAVLSGWSVFLSPMTGILVSDSFLIRKGQYHLGDLYVGDSRSAYWYSWGFNFRAFLAWVFGTAPLLPGFARAIQGTTAGVGWDRLYQLSYFYGFFASLASYAALFAVLPPARQNGSSPFVLETNAQVQNHAVGGERSGGNARGSGDGKKKNRRWDFSGCVSTFTPGAKV